MRDGAGVTEVVNASQAALGHGEGNGQQLGEHSHGVGDVHDAVVLDDLGDEVARRQVVGDRHAHTQCAGGGVLGQQVLHKSLEKANTMTVRRWFLRR